jgi:hypothetical protein
VHQFLTKGIGVGVKSLDVDLIVIILRSRLKVLAGGLDLCPKVEGFSSGCF